MVPAKFNIDTKHDDLENVSPCKYDYVLWHLSCISGWAPKNLSSNQMGPY